MREIVKATCIQIWNLLHPVYMPEKSVEDWINIANQFYGRTNFPNIIGAIDGKHIRIIQPANSGSGCFNYKKYFSIVLMAWVDADYKFVYIDIGANGAASDASIFLNSNMGKRLQQNQLNIPNTPVYQTTKMEKICHFVWWQMRHLACQGTYYDHTQENH